jgi:ABC-type transport system involved in multi-copper enzyme maturation permease subunit
MDLFSLMLLREFFTGPRRRWFHAKRMLFAAVAGSLILVTFVFTASKARGQAGLALFQLISLLSVVAACLLGPYIAASSLISEKEGRTLDLLYMSDLTASQLIFSKLVTAMVGASFTVLSITPMFLLCVSLGGVAEVQILSAMLVLFTAVVLGTALGMLVGVMVDSESQTQRALVLGFLLIFGLLPAVGYVFAALTK